MKYGRSITFATTSDLELDKQRGNTTPTNRNIVRALYSLRSAGHILIYEGVRIRWQSFIHWGRCCGADKLNPNMTLSDVVKWQYAQRKHNR